MASTATPATSAATNPVLFGDQTVESNQDSNTAGVAQAWPFSNSKNGTASSISVYVDSANTAAKLIVGLYGNNNGKPGSLLSSGSLSNPKKAAWNTIGIRSASLNSGKTYWVALLGANGTPYFRDRANASCSSQGSALTNLTSLPSTWSKGPSWGSCPVSAYVNASVATTTAPPVNTAPPTISGTPQQGNTLSEADGTWTGSPASYAYQWQVCDSSGANCSNASGETSKTYALDSGDVGHTIRGVTTASNAGGSASANTAPTNVITTARVAAPSNTVPPAISGMAQQGSTLTASTGTWTASPTGYTYRWQNCTNSGTCTPISGAMSGTYALQSSDVGDTVDVVVTASNSGGSALATSAPVGPVAAPASSGAVPCALTAAAESCWASHTGVTGATGYTEAQIEAGQGGFTHVTGNVTITTNGATIDHEWISGCIAVNASNVTIKNTLIATNNACQGGNGNALGGGINDGNGSTPTGLLVEDTTIDGQNIAQDASGVGADNFECLRCAISGYTHNTTPGANVTIQDSYFHSLTTWTSGGSNCSNIPHEETIYADSASNVTVEHSYLRSSGGNGCVAAAIFNGNTYGAANGLTVDSSYVEGDTGFDIEIGCSNTNIQVTNDALSSNAKAYSAEAGPGNWAWGSNGNKWSGNYDSATMAPISAGGVGCS